MKRFLSWQVFLGLALIMLSAAVYYFHYFIFRDAHHIFIYLLGDIAFVFLEVLLVTLVLHQLLHYQEKKTMLNKLNMVIGAFFSEIGTELLKIFSIFNKNNFNVTKDLIVTDQWSEKEFLEISKKIKKHKYDIDSEKVDLGLLKEFLKGKRRFLLGLLGNPNLLEHESFTNLLWAVFHLTEELIHRKSFKKIFTTDRQHLEGDIKRVYGLLIIEWLNYMQHLKGNYPYLFSLAMRTNPFDCDTSIEVL